MVGRSGFLSLFILFLFVFGCSTPDSTVVQKRDTSDSEPEQKAEQTYHVRDLRISYLRKHPDQPSTDWLRKTSVRLKDTKEELQVPDDELEGETRTIDEWFNTSDDRTVALTHSALNAVNKAIIERLNQEGFIGVHARPHPEDISRLGEDLRKEDERDLRILVHMSEIERVHTRAMGERFEGEEQKRNRSEHAWIRNQSPLSEPTEGQPADLLKKPLIDQYVNYLSRHQGRNVTASVGDAGDGRAVLEYNVTEVKPWTAFAQISNTGTENTDELQERAGFIHRQATGYDDTLRLDYTTAGFGQDMNNVQTSYERPFTLGGSTRFRVDGSYNEFTASDVGILGGDFEGETWGGGLSIEQNVIQIDHWFLDLTAGGTWKSISTFNNITQVSVEEEFLTPRLGLQLERNSQVANTTGSVSVKRNLADVADTDESKIPGLGRDRTDADYTVLNGRFSHSFFLEPVIYGSSWSDPETPETSTRAHELRTSARGQYGFDNRLIPQESFVAGGMFSARGYPESAASGDSGVVSSLEYRLHLPRLFPVEQEPAELFGSPFRFAPENVFGTPDWDFVLSAFVDYGRTTVNDKIPGVEFDETFLSYGVGAELIMLRNVRFQSYYGIVGKDLENGEAEEGDDEFHFLFQISY